MLVRRVYIRLLSRIPPGVDPYPVTQQRGVPSIFKHVQETVCGGAQSASCRGDPLSNNGVEIVCMRLRKHIRRTTTPRQPKQYPERIIILDTQIAVCPLCKTGPKTARVKRLAESFEKGDFDLDSYNVQIFEPACYTEQPATCVPSRCLHCRWDQQWPNELST